MAFSTVCLGVVLLRYQSPVVRGVCFELLGAHVYEFVVTKSACTVWYTETAHV